MKIREERIIDLQGTLFEVKEQLDELCVHAVSCMWEDTCINVEGTLEFSRQPLAEEKERERERQREQLKKKLAWSLNRAKTTPVPPKLIQRADETDKDFEDRCKWENILYRMRMDDFREALDNLRSAQEELEALG